MIDTLTISRELTKAEHPRATGPNEPDAQREQTKKPPTTHQPQTDWWHEDLVFRALPYCVHVVDRRAEILDRRCRLIIALNLRRKPTDRRLAALTHNGKVHDAKDGSRMAFLYDDGCTPRRVWEAYTSRLEKLGRWDGRITIMGEIMNTRARRAVVTLPDLLPLPAVTADMRRRWWVLVEKPSYQDTLKPFPQSIARQRWVLAFICTALKAGLPLRDDTDRRGWRSLEDPAIWACDEANWRTMGGHQDALRRNKHGGLRAAVQDQLISRWRAMARIGVTTVWAAPDGRYIGALGDGVRSPVLTAEMTGSQEAGV